MGQWADESRTHNSPSDRCSEASADSGRGGSEGVPSISITCPGDVVIYEFEFPSELCGRLIGKGGRNLHQTMAETNTRMTLRKQPFNEDHQIVSVVGKQEDVQAVLQSVRHKFPKHRHPEVDLRPVQLPVPQELLVPDIQPLSLPDYAVVDVAASAVISTSHLFLQLPSHHTYPNLPRLDACMLSCYNQPGAPPLPSPVEPGVICAAPQSGGWYRAQIVELLPSLAPVETDTNEEQFDASLRYVDYGGYARVPLSSLRQIRSDFIALPFQAIECYLANLAPPNEESYEFSAEGAYLLETLVKGAALQAEVVAYAEDGVPCIYLYRTNMLSHDMQPSINEEMVMNGHAKWAENFIVDSGVQEQTYYEETTTVVEDFPASDNSQTTLASSSSSLPSECNTQENDNGFSVPTNCIEVS